MDYRPMRSGMGCTPISVTGTGIRVHQHSRKLRVASRVVVNREHLLSKLWWPVWLIGAIPLLFVFSVVHLCTRHSRFVLDYNLGLGHMPAAPRWKGLSAQLMRLFYRIRRSDFSMQCINDKIIPSRTSYIYNSVALVFPTHPFQFSIA